MGKKKGKTLPLSTLCRLIGDLLYFARGVPSVPVQRLMNLADLVEACACADRRVSWCAIFTKAFARTAALTPELRRSYLKFPWARLYEHPYSVASIAVDARLSGRKRRLIRASNGAGKQDAPYAGRASQAVQNRSHRKPCAFPPCSGHRSLAVLCASAGVVVCAERLRSLARRRGRNLRRQRLFGIGSGIAASAVAAHVHAPLRRPSGRRRSPRTHHL